MTKNCANIRCGGEGIPVDKNKDGTSEGIFFGSLLGNTGVIGPA